MSLTIFLHTPDSAKVPIQYYFPGTVISGSLILGLSTTVNCEYLNVTFSGKAKTSFFVYPYNTRFSDQQTVIKIVSMLHPPGIIRKGRYIFPFEFDLPVGIPSTFKSLRGQVNYEITGELKISNLFACDVKEHIDVFIHPNLDLNLLSWDDYGPYEISKEVEVQNTACCLLSSKNETLGLTISLPSRLIALGEFIKFRVKVDNRTKRLVHTLRMELFKKFIYRGKRKDDRNSVEEKAHEEVCEEAAGPEVPSYSVIVWDDGNKVLIPVKTNPDVSGLGGVCRIIDLQYFLRFTVKFEERCCSAFKDVEQCVPVIVGNIPVLPKESNLQCEGMSDSQ